MKNLLVILLILTSVSAFAKRIVQKENLEKCTKSGKRIQKNWQNF